MCAGRHMICPDATEIWHDVDIIANPDRVCFPRLKHQEIMSGVSGEEYSSGRKTQQRSRMYVCFAYYCSATVTLKPRPHTLVLQVTPSWGKLKFISQRRGRSRGNNT